MKPLSKGEITAQAALIKGWRIESGSLVRSLTFADFQEAWQFMSHVAECAEAQDHHPNWYNAYNLVEIRLYTHTVDGLTERDFKLAESINQYLFQFGYQKQVDLEKS